MQGRFLLRSSGSGPHAVQVKVCGFTDEKNISSVASLPIDAAGFVLFRKSSRYVPSDRLDSLIRTLPDRVTPVLLFVNPDPDEVFAVTRRHPEVLLQFHGDETPEFCRAFGLPYMKAVHFEKPGDLLRAEARYPDAAAILADCPAPDSGAAPGGNGTAFDWELARSEAASLTLPLVLAGGLNAENAAIRTKVSFFVRHVVHVRFLYRQRSRRGNLFRPETPLLQALSEALLKNHGFSVWT